MSHKQIIKAAVSVAGTAIGIALYQRIVVGASAFPTASLVLSEPAEFGTYFYPFRVAATIFGADATNFDYHLASDGTAATEALAAYTTIDNTPESDGLSGQIQPQNYKSPLAARYNDGLSSFGNDTEEREVSDPNDSKNPKL
ncbi:hypothetical protein BHYA_0316g00060 [Botrytis hyacinthi]|uniref:Uncharacterized protein n=1 Tax=Botrytis hyacinthi TaxID=278943 RepID=A0A4Z1GDS3_9HELO|nr:hypothetical protein BHYA_0316g00060 [Botrytis hyacinthi]